MSDDDDSEEEMYSVTSSKTIYKRSHSRPSKSRKIIYRSDSDDASTEYGPVAKWAVDYNNRNFVRSKCHKNKGLHREIKGRPFDWHVEYDNNFFARSKVNELKGLHRMLPDVKRKYVPDEDDLADATGWEFDCGPEFDQAEQDVTYIPEGRIVARGCYRWYGTKRNNSDFDFSEQEHRENLLNEELEEELKYGQEFLQADVPHMSEQLKRQHSRGGYRWYEVERNAYDIMPEHVPNAERDPEWRRKHHCNGFRYLDLGMCELDSEGEDRERYVTKGKPFKRTILNKVYELRRRSSPRSARYRTRTSLMPGEGEKTTYHGIPDRFPFQEKRAPSLRHVFKRRTDTKKYRTSEAGSDYEEHEMEEVERRQGLSPKYESRARHLADQTRRSRGRSAYEDEYRERGRGGRADEYVYKVTPTEESGVQKRPTRAIVKESDLDEDVRQTFETWKENIDNRKHPHEEGRRKEKEKRKEAEVYGDRDYPPQRNKNIDNRKHPHEEGRRKEKEKRRGTEVYGDRDYPPPRSKVADQRSHKPKEYSHSDYESGSSGASSKSTTHHREEPTKKSQVADRKRDKSKAHDLQPHGSKGNRKALDEEFEEMSGEKHDGVKKMPPHVQERIGKIRQRIEKNVERLDDKKRKNHRTEKLSGIEDIDLMKHKSHPKDKGETHSSEYEKYVTKNGSEVWLKKEEKLAELHHKNP